MSLLTFMRNILRGDKKFWSSIAISAGLTILFFGITFISISQLIGFVDIAFGILLIITGFLTAPFRESGTNQQNLRAGKAQAMEVTSLDKEEKEFYCKERISLVDALKDQSRSFDKYVLTLAAGSFGLSLLFIQQIAPNLKANTVPFLTGAWIAFGVSILLTLLSFLFSQKACKKEIEIIDGILFGNAIDNGKNAKNFFTTLTHRLNWISMILFMIGVFLLITFSVLNLSF